MIDVLLNNEIEFELPKSLEPVIRAILADHGISRGEVSLAVVDDPTMHALNREHLQHDYPTDVLSFLLDSNGEEIDGEVIVSCDTAVTVATEYEWSAQDETLLYFIHGCLHLVGYDDHCDADRASMREQEAKYLELAGVKVPADHCKRVLQGTEEAAE